MAQEKFNIKKFFDFSPVAVATAVGLALKLAVIALLIFGTLTVGVKIYRIFFPKEVTANINQPIYHVEAGGTVNSSVVQNKEKLNEVGVFGGPIYYDEKVGGFLGIGFKRRF